MTLASLSMGGSLQHSPAAARSRAAWSAPQRRVVPKAARRKQVGVASEHDDSHPAGLGAGVACERGAVAQGHLELGDQHVRRRSLTQAHDRRPRRRELRRRRSRPRSSRPASRWLERKSPSTSRILSARRRACRT